MSDDYIARLIGEQRKRLIASIMGHAEASSWWKTMTPGDQRAFRDKVLASIGTFYDFCRDVVRVTGEDAVRNELSIDLLREVHEGQQAIVREMRRG